MLGSMDPARKLATYADLLALPEGAKGEVLGGELVTDPSPLPEHGRIQGTLWRGIGGPFDGDDGRGGPGGWWILVEIDVRFGPNDIARPDLAGWRRERLRNPFGKRPIDTRPDWICEIASPSNAQVDRVTKRALYAEHEVPYYWLVDPATRVLEALKLVDGRWVELGAWGDTGAARIEPFDAVELELDRIFPPIIEDD